MRGGVVRVLPFLRRARPSGTGWFRVARVRVLVIAAREDVTMLREVMQVVGTPAPAGAGR